MEDNEQLIGQFFKEHRQEIADNGFTEKLMQSLPERTPQFEWLPWVWNGVMITISVVLFIALGGVPMVLGHLSSSLDMALTQGIDMRLLAMMLVAFIFFVCNKALKEAR